MQRRLDVPILVGTIKTPLSVMPSRSQRIDDDMHAQEHIYSGCNMIL